jgi:heavy metal translocating P-type ATPase
MAQLLFLYKNFRIPLIIFAGILLYLLLLSVKIPLAAFLIVSITIGLGTYTLIKEILASLLKKQFALDYIAILAITTSLITKEYLVAAVISLMLATGRALEAYGIKQAKKSLSLLVNRIPQSVLLYEQNQPGKKEQIAQVKVGQEIFIRKGEIIPLDGILVSDQGFTDESSLTGEPYFVDKLQGDTMRSGTINTGAPIVIKVTKPDKDSTYKKIISMVENAQDEKSPFIRLSDKYSTYFTLITLAIAGLAFLIHHDLQSILAVLVIATPCPLIIATPIALLGGMNKAAKRRIIVKKLTSLEALARITALVFDKTGTITLGKPALTKIECLDPDYSENRVLAIGEALERNSLHPIAKTIIAYAKKKHVSTPRAHHIEEKIGTGISGTIDGKTYTLSKLENSGQIGMAIGLFLDEKELAIFHFEDSIKKESKQTITNLKKLGLALHIFTGDKKVVAEQIAAQLEEQVHIEAELKPEDKQKLIGILKSSESISGQKSVVAMVGDGINDAPALAKADVGLVFSNEEQTAASEAADIVLLGGDFSLVSDTIHIAKRTIRIAIQSISWGIGLSIGGMMLAAFGYIPPLLGAGIQEAIDVAVIINALRASR